MIVFFSSKELELSIAEQYECPETVPKSSLKLLNVDLFQRVLCVPLNPLVYFVFVEVTVAYLPISPD